MIKVNSSLAGLTEADTGDISYRKNTEFKKKLRQSQHSAAKVEVFEHVDIIWVYG